ncbi:hypothetical protein ABIA22_000395 [Sinorhizobium fredii]|uniref:bifunctional DNA primase/polymerase n=1 Tax=Rhizobium fredii TaxID=380 RepID=UPI00351761FB
MGAFAEWQPQYAAHGIATFPVVIDGKDKKPAVKGYLKIGTKVSDQLALKFPANDAFGLACRRNRITVLDVDTSDERVLADALSRHGPTPFIVRSGSGNWQAWYRHSGERRRVRPDPGLPIDILGDGYVVAPPSLGAKGRYEIVQGTLDDLERLQPMVHPVLEDVVDVFVSHEAPPRKPHSEMREGDGRNPSLFSRALRSAHHATTEEELIQMVAHANQQFAEPLPMDEVLSVTRSAWKYKSQGRLMVTGGEATAVVFKSDTDHLWDAPVALSLLVRLRMTNGWRNGGSFPLAQGMAKSMGVSIPTYRAARDTLVDRFFLEILHPGGKGKNDPAIVRLL